MQKRYKIQPIVSLHQISSQQQLFPPMQHNQSYSQQPTIMFLNSNRDSLNYLIRKHQSENKIIFKNQINNKCQSDNLLDTQEDKKQQDDTEFVSRYLTPIKKQQSNHQIKQIHQKNKSNLKIYDKKTNKTKANHQPSPQFSSNKKTDQKHTKQAIQQKQTKQAKSTKPFMPDQIFCQSQKELKRSQNVSKQISLYPDISSQISFLRSNNHKLYQKLTQQTKKTIFLQQKIKTLQNDNFKYKQLYHKQVEKVEKLNTIVQKFTIERKQIIQRQWKEFQLLKQYLIVNKNSKSKQKSQHTKSNYYIQNYNKPTHMQDYNILTNKQDSNKQINKQDFQNIQVRLNNLKRSRKQVQIINKTKQNIRQVNKNNKQLQTELKKPISYKKQTSNQKQIKVLLNKFNLMDPKIGSHIKNKQNLHNGKLIQSKLKIKSSSKDYQISNQISKQKHNKSRSALKANALKKKNYFLTERN